MFILLFVVMSRRCHGSHEVFVNSATVKYLGLGTHSVDRLLDLNRKLNCIEIQAGSATLHERSLRDKAAGSLRYCRNTRHL